MDDIVVDEALHCQEKNAGKDPAARHGRGYSNGQGEIGRPRESSP
jgi:hypothetical protein